MLQFITHHTSRYNHIEGAIAALEGGCKWIQLRMKETNKEDILHAIEQLKPICRKHNAILIIDDYVELASQTDIDGVHLGKNDMPISQARQILGEEYIIGGTANTFEDIQSLTEQGVDYIGLGPFRYTETKQNLSPILGIEGYRKMMQQCRECGINTPIVAIGGIEEEDVEPLMSTGISGIAMSGCILRNDNPMYQTNQIIKTLNHIIYGE